MINDRSRDFWVVVARSILKFTHPWMTSTSHLHALILTLTRSRSDARTRTFHFTRVTSGRFTTVAFLLSS